MDFDLAFWGHTFRLVMATYGVVIFTYWFVKVCIEKGETGAFFIYMLLLMVGIEYAAIPQIIAKYIRMLDHQDAFDLFCSSTWWQTKDYLLSLSLLFINVHASARLWKYHKAKDCK